MKALTRLTVVLALGAVPAAGWAKGPVVVELFTAQGCASCKQANSLIARMVDKPDLIVLTWAVDYWDYLGWKDTFAQPEFTIRQKAFAKRLGPQDVYTPQVVVDGLRQVSGDDAASVEALIGEAAADHPRPPKIRILGGGRVTIAAGYLDHGAADVWLVRYDPREQDVAVTEGDNRGATVTHRNVVRQVIRLGPWRGHAVAYTLPTPSEKGLSSVVILQGVRGGPVLAAAKAK